eukprot:2444273-Pleurochrysis_carterae.AAC.1
MVRLFAFREAVSIVLKARPRLAPTEASLAAAEGCLCAAPAPAHGFGRVSSRLWVSRRLCTRVPHFSACECCIGSLRGCLGTSTSSVQSTEWRGDADADGDMGVLARAMRRIYPR